MKAFWALLAALAAAAAIVVFGLGGGEGEGAPGAREAEPAPGGRAMEEAARQPVAADAVGSAASAPAAAAPTTPTARDEPTPADGDITTQVFVMHAPPAMVREHDAAADGDAVPAAEGGPPDDAGGAAPAAPAPTATGDVPDERAQAGEPEATPSIDELLGIPAETGEEETVAADGGELALPPADEQSGPLAPSHAPAATHPAPVHGSGPGQHVAGSGARHAAPPEAPAAQAPAPAADRERFTVTGSGTAEDPFIVSWALLVSASETYKPRAGKREIPERIEALNGKYVKVSGFVAFPFMAQEAKELLLMQNQWDGCCIGVPPTAYDAIEVTLRDFADPVQRFLQYGAVTGRLKVDPYVRGEWLISLYVMEDATLTPEM